MTMLHQRPLLCGALAVTLAFGLAPPPAAAQEAQPAPAALAPDDDDEAPAFDATALGIRRQQLGLHQGLALGTLGMMAVTATLGYASTHNPAAAVDLRGLHLAAAGLTTGLYVATGTLAFTTPPPLPGASRPFSGIEVHRTLAWLHMAGMAGTVGLGLANVLNPGQLTPPHGLASYATLGLMATSAAAIAFGE
ncbi:MAG: hypothetical protein VKQ33_01285 [Candidatus Sericytochromatia bacterium]|nr:hypothetical protein [Candidatus Sericytochromatia bacterium]